MKIVQIQVSIPFHAGPSLRPIDIREPTKVSDPPCFNPLSCGAFTATRRPGSARRFGRGEFQSPFMRGLHCDKRQKDFSILNSVEKVSIPFMRGLHCDLEVALREVFYVPVSIPFHAGPSLRLPIRRGRVGDPGPPSFNPLSCGAFTATL